MPIYNYFCGECNTYYEIFHKMEDTKKSVCSNCNKESLNKVPCIPNIITDLSQPKTVGDLANKNTENMVKDGKLPKSALEYDTAIKKRQIKHNKLKDLGNLSPKQKERYIYEGKY